jgi:hypothetical protein
VMRCGIWWWCLLLLLFLLYIHCYFLPQACECLPLFDTDSYDAYNIYIYIPSPTCSPMFVNYLGEMGAQWGASHNSLPNIVRLSAPKVPCELDFFGPSKWRARCPTWSTP